MKKINDSLEQLTTIIPNQKSAKIRRSIISSNPLILLFFKLTRPFRCTKRINIDQYIHSDPFDFKIEV